MLILERYSVLQLALIRRRCCPHRDVHVQERQVRFAKRVQEVERADSVTQCGTAVTSLETGGSAMLGAVRKTIRCDCSVVSPKLNNGEESPTVRYTGISSALNDVGEWSMCGTQRISTE